MSPNKYIRDRWKIFVSYSTIHGVKEMDFAPTWFLRMLWLLLLLSFGGLMSYQIYKLTDQFLQEPVVVVIKTTSDIATSEDLTANKYTKYKLPLTLMVVPTMDLFNASPDANRALAESPFDTHSRYYIRSLVDSDFQVPDDYNGTIGRRNFDQYLTDNPHLSWHDVISPFVANISYWLGHETFSGFSFVNRTISSYMTYHFMQPVFDDNAELSVVDEAKGILLPAFIDFNPHVMNRSTSDHGRTPLFSLTSYGLATDMIRLKGGISYKISFDITGHRKISLTRRPCAVGQIQYQSYDYEACDHQCLFDAEHQLIPKICYKHTHDWGFYRTFLIARPCSHGVHYNAASEEEGGFLTDRESESYITEPTPENHLKVDQAYKSCLKERCAHACQQMSVKFHVKSSDFHERLGNKSMIWIKWPGPGAVHVYVEMMQYTWDVYVGQVGGLMGLWIGASVVSIFELFYICCCCCVGVKKSEKEDKRFSFTFEEKGKDAE